jgi:hypothetical protein
MSSMPTLVCLFPVANICERGNNYVTAPGSSRSSKPDIAALATTPPSALAHPGRTGTNASSPGCKLSFSGSHETPKRYLPPDSSPEGRFNGGTLGGTSSDSHQSRQA